MQLARQADGLGAERRSGQGSPGRRGVAFGEDEVQHVGHRGHPCRHLRHGRHGEGIGHLLQSDLGADDALRHGRLGDEERAGDLRRGETGNGTQGECHLRRPAQRRVAAQQHHRERVVAIDGRILGAHRAQIVRRSVSGHALLAPGAGAVGAQPVDEPARRHPNQPGLRIVGRSLGGPLASGGDERLLQRVLREVESAVAAHERTEHVWRARPPDDVEARVAHASGPPAHIAGRSSITSPGWANAAAISSARSRDSTSTRKNPARCSLVSA